MPEGEPQQRQSSKPNADREEPAVEPPAREADVLEEDDDFEDFPFEGLFTSLHCPRTHTRYEPHQSK